MKSALRDCSNSLRAMLEQELRDDVDLSPFFDPLDPSPTAIGTFVVTLNNPEEFAENELEGRVDLAVPGRARRRDAEPAASAASRPTACCRRPLPLRLHYLMTPRVNHRTREQAGELEQLILGKIAAGAARQAAPGRRASASMR